MLNRARKPVHAVLNDIICIREIQFLIPIFRWRTQFLCKFHDNKTSLRQWHFLLRIALGPFLVPCCLCSSSILGYELLPLDNETQFLGSNFDLFDWAAAVARNRLICRRNEIRFEFGICNNFFSLQLLIYSNLLIYLATLCLAAFNTLIIFSNTNFQFQNSAMRQINCSDLILIRNWKMRFEVKLHNSFASSIPSVWNWNASKPSGLFMFSCINTAYLCMWSDVRVNKSHITSKNQLPDISISTYTERRLNDGTCHFSNLFHFRLTNEENEKFRMHKICSLSKAFSLSKLPHGFFGSMVKGCWRQFSAAYFNGNMHKR